MASAIEFIHKLPQIMTGFIIAIIIMSLVRTIARAIIIGFLGTDGRFVIGLIEAIVAVSMAVKAHNNPAVIFTVVGWCAGLVYAFMPESMRDML